MKVFSKPKIKEYEIVLIVSDTFIEDLYHALEAIREQSAEKIQLTLR